ncbi:MAG: hypothetical protein IT287_09985 [Bdellovibrionaceae bacterium]|nr:hypothetical protein [Pseudobdellovibrionaceae bacterium]
MSRIKSENLLLLLFYVLITPSRGFTANACYDIFRLQATQELPSELTIMSYNVQNLAQAVGGFRRNERKQLQPVADRPPFPKPEEKSGRILSILNEVRADIFILTEVESLSALKGAANSLHESYRYFMMEGNDMRNINISFLVKKDLDLDIFFESHKHMKWRDPVDNQVDKLFTRDAPTLILHRAGDPHPFLILIGVHAKSRRDRRGDPKSLMWRKAEFQGYISIIKGYKQRYGDKIPIILAGDLNTDVLRSPEMEVLREELSSAFDSAAVATPVKDRITHTYHPQSQPVERLQLDDIQITPSLKNNILEAQIYPYRSKDGNLIPLPLTIEERNQLPSDHWPVYIRLSTDGL